MSLTIETNFGNLDVEWYHEQVPRLCKNFLALAASGQYNQSKFHRNVKGSLIQGGDPTGTGKGGRAWHGGFEKDEFHPSLRHNRRGIVSFSSKNKPDTIGSQFFITYAPLPKLDGKFSVIGHVVGGLDVLAKLEVMEVDEHQCPVEDVLITDVLIKSNPIAEAERGHQEA